MPCCRAQDRTGDPADRNRPIGGEPTETMADDDAKSIRDALLSLAAVGALLAFSYAGADAAGTGERARARAMLDTADGLLDMATSIYGRMPHTHAAGAALVSGDQGPAGQFYARDHRFQQDLGDARSWQDQDDRNAMLDLSVAEGALYNVVVTTVTNCDASDAKANLRVARSVINEAHLDYAGKGKDDYSPPEIDESNTDHCDS